MRQRIFLEGAVQKDRLSSELNEVSLHFQVIPQVYSHKNTTVEGTLKQFHPKFMSGSTMKALTISHLDDPEVP